MRQAILKSAVETFGKEHQLLKTAEELGELSSAIIRYVLMTMFDFYNEISVEKKEKLIDNLHEETADVIDMCDQLKHVLLDTQEVEKHQYYKELRLQDIIRQIEKVRRKF